MRPISVAAAVDGIVRDAERRAEFHYTLIEVAAESIAGDPVAASDIDAVRWADPEEAMRLVQWDETRRVIAEAMRLRKL